MPIPYKIVQRPNPQKPDDPALYYLQAVPGRIIELDESSTDCALISGVSQGDCLNVITTFLERSGYQLCQGNSVRLPKFGIWRPGLTGAHGAATPEELSHVKKEADVHFRPDQELKERLNRAGSTNTGDVTQIQPPTP